MVFVKIQGQCIWRDCASIGELKEVSRRDRDSFTEVLSRCDFYYEGRPLRDEEFLLPENATVETVFGLPGGKGGFGSMLRALGAQIEKTTNKDACRDLSGRRLRDINEEEKLKEWISKQADREKEAQEKKEAKLSKLRKVANGENKHEFNDPEFEKSREETTDKVHEALEHAINVTKIEILSTKSKPQKRKSDIDEKGPSKKKGMTFIGVDLTESDLESDDEE